MRELARARTALALTFAVKGIAFAAMVSRTPAIRDALGLSVGQLGLLLLCLSGGAIAGLPIAGPVVHRLGARRAVVLGGLVVGAGLGGLGLALAVASVPVAAAGMTLIGLGNGIWDVAINVEGVGLERRSGRSLLPRLHGVFSIGTMAGAGLGTASAALHLSPGAQMAALALGVPVALAVLARAFLPVPAAAPPPARQDRRTRAWREPRTILLGLLVFGFALSEGAASDWIAVAFVDGHGTADTVGALAYWMFVTAMTAGRLIGGRFADRIGRARLLRISAAVAAAGLALVLFGGGVPIALAGPLLWGLGTALGFPLGISAAGEGDAARSASRVAVVSSIGYAAFLAGPPVLGVLAGRTGILHALLVVLGAPLIAFLAAGAARRRRPHDEPTAPEPLDSGRSPEHAHRTPHP